MRQEQGMRRAKQGQRSQGGSRRKRRRGGAILGDFFFAISQPLATFDKLQRDLSWLEQWPSPQRGRGKEQTFSFVFKRKKKYQINSKKRE